jgi:anti-anti-sigma regulatory factor
MNQGLPSMFVQNSETEVTTQAIRIRPFGPLIDRDNAREAIETATELVNAHSGQLRRLVIDLRGVVNPNSMAVSMLLEMLHIAREHDLEPVVHGPNHDLIQLLRMLKLDGRYTMSLSRRELTRAMAA